MESNMENNQMTCPKCQTVQPQSDTCRKCGIIIAKYHANQRNNQSRLPTTKVSKPTSVKHAQVRPKNAMTRTQSIIAIIITLLFVVGIFQYSQYQEQQRLAKEARAATKRAAAKQAEEDRRRSLMKPTATPPTREVTQAEFGTAWPLTVTGGIIRCEPSPDGYHYVTFLSNGQTYAVNGTAAGVASRKGWREIDEIWKDDLENPGLKISITPVLDAGLALCKK